MNIKDITSILGTIVIGTSLLTSCSNNQQTPDANNPADKESSKTISKVLPCNNTFIAITNICNVDITYTPGDYKLEAIGDSALISRLNTTFDSGTLTISLKGDNQVELTSVKTKQDIHLNISSPELKIVSICNNGSFESKGTIQTDVFQIGNLGSGNMKLDSIICNNLRADNNDMGDMQFKHINCESAMFTTLGTTSTSAHIKAINDISVVSGEKSTSNISAESKSITIASRNKSKVTLNANCTSLTATTINNAEITLNGTAKTTTLKNSMGSNIVNNLAKK